MMGSKHRLLMFHQPTYLLYISYTYLPTYLLFYLLTNKSQSFTRLVTQGETRCQLTYSWRSHPQVSHQRLPMDGGGAGGGGGGGGGS